MDQLRSAPDYRLELPDVINAEPESRVGQFRERDEGLAAEPIDHAGKAGARCCYYYGLHIFR